MGRRAKSPEQLFAAYRRIQQTLRFVYTGECEPHPYHLAVASGAPCPEIAFRDDCEAEREIVASIDESLKAAVVLWQPTIPSEYPSSRTGIYVAFFDGQPVYAGMASDMARRIMSHMTGIRRNAKKNQWWHRVGADLGELGRRVIWVVAPFDGSKEDLEFLEVLVIHKLKPVGNVQFSRRH